MDGRNLSKAERKRLWQAECDSCINPDTLVKDGEILALHREGLPAVEIAARLNVAPELIRYRLRRLGYEAIRAARFARAEELRKDVIELHRQGQPPKDIAERLGLDLSRVYRILREAELEPHPSHEEIENTLRGLGEIVRLGEQDVPRYEIVKRTGSTWPLVAEALEKAGVRRVAPACAEIASWASSLSPIVDEIRRAAPDTEAVQRKVDRLERELTAITEAARFVEGQLPWRGVKGDEERWCVGSISYLAHRGLDAIDALKGCIKALDVEKLPKLLEQAETCVTNICNLVAGAISEAGAKGEKTRRP